MKRHITRFGLLMASFLLILSSCNNSGPDSRSTLDKEGSGKCTVEEVVQVSGYTYMRVSEKGKEFWMAVSTMDAQVGDTYYYADGMEMKDFTSKELGRTFDSVLFVQLISKEPISDTKTSAGMHGGSSMKGDVSSMPRPEAEQIEVDTEPLAEGPSIATLFERKNEFAGKTVTLRGQVTKVNNGIMDRNWVHMQDGTSFDGHFDLTLTTEASFEVGDIITVQGILAIDKDFGYGYAYPVLLEGAIAK